MGDLDQSFQDHSASWREHISGRRGSRPSRDSQNTTPVVQILVIPTGFHSSMHLLDFGNERNPKILIWLTSWWIFPIAHGLQSRYLKESSLYLKLAAKRYDRLSLAKAPLHHCQPKHPRNAWVTKLAVAIIAKDVSDRLN